tara:strand:- start:280 stop:693 length:414 start_codon:yes stop_codon:yes gene_type:complete
MVYLETHSCVNPIYLSKNQIIIKGSGKELEVVTKTTYDFNDIKRLVDGLFREFSNFEFTIYRLLYNISGELDHLLIPKSIARQKMKTINITDDIEVTIYKNGKFSFTCENEEHIEIIYSRFYQKISLLLVQDCVEIA